MLKGSMNVIQQSSSVFVNDPGGQFSLFGRRKREETTFVSNLMSRDKDGKKIFFASIVTFCQRFALNGSSEKKETWD